MRLAIIGIAVLFLSGQDLSACSMAPRVAPLIYERLAEGGQYVLAMVESPDAYRRAYRYEPTDEALRILATYPASGVYRIDNRLDPVLEIDSPLEPSEIVGFFERNDSVYLITGPNGYLRFYRDGLLIRRIQPHDALEWLAAPWFVVYSCGGSLFEATLDEDALSVSARTPDGAVFRYSALTGKLVDVQRPAPGAPAVVNPAELDLAGIVAGLLEEGRKHPIDDLGLEPYLADYWLADCSDIGGPDDSLGSQMEAEDFRELSAGLGVDAPGGSRLRHSRETSFDLYRIAAGHGSQFLCGGDALKLDWVRDAFDHQTEPNERESAWTYFEAGLSGPTVAAITTWAIEDDEEIDRIGLALLWSRATGEWRIVMAQVFYPPKTEQHAP